MLNNPKGRTGLRFWSFLKQRYHIYIHIGHFSLPGPLTKVVLVTPRKLFLLLVRVTSSSWSKESFKLNNDNEHRIEEEK